MRWFVRMMLVPCALLMGTVLAPGQGKFGEPAPEFPPGVFTDGQQHRIADMQGKVVVLYFFEKG